MSSDSEMRSFSDGDVRFWLVDGTVHIKAVDSLGDPVELTDVEVKQLAEALLDSIRKA